LACDNQRNLSCDELRNIADQDNPDVYLYVITTIEYEGGQFCQCGTGPNFQGDLITLCTCKHRMRSSMITDNWKGKWIAGFTSRTCVNEHQGEHFLFYLMKVSDAFESFRDLWYGTNILNTGKNAKAAHRDRLGDIYEPNRRNIDPYNADDYVNPCQKLGANYDRDSCWRKDIKYYNERFKRHAALLVGDKRKSFLWSSPTIRYAHQLPRDYKKLSFQEFLNRLEEI